MATVTFVRGRSRRGASLSFADGDVFTFDATTDESATDEGTLTEHPVETGVKVNDHFQMKPSDLSLSVVVSRTPFDEAEAVPDRDVRAYERLLAVLRAGEPLTIITPLRTYPNMVLVKVSNQRGADTGQKIAPTLDFKEIVFASAEFVTIPPTILGRRRRSASSKKNKGTKPAEAADTASGEATSATANAAAEAESRKEGEGAGSSTLADLLG